ncbi:lytic transglycosylase domain-containing protein [Rhizobium sp. RM]|uniref:lytic transglycosylase domain-containing protein n=1 Tax=Rhizobium sp. RM TaxID=2748079 RepID=UPI00110D6B9A|nr:lytic transglycosylase domain-containing protein [Rhizobium sp. RM]NWJ25388.1 lytic transglycosylase domain-containing protein [Rhizobium sp. RM]TMV17530.1 lytic transglycosylase domain-containing protein [Rhizobium sp. Td3]
MKNENVVLVSLLVSAFCFFAVKAAKAVESLQTHGNAHEKASSISDFSATTAYGFEQRWGGGGNAFVDVLLSEGDDVSQGEAVAVATNKKDVNDSQVKRPYKVLPKPPTVTARSVDIPGECGASPLSPDQIEKLVRATAVKFGVDEELAVAVAWTESRFDQVRNSPAGARGAMQLIPATAVRFNVADICDPAQNIEGGVKYLRFLLDEFTNPLLAVAAYNSGEGRIYEHGGIPPFPETIEYVAKVTNYQLGVTLPAKKANSTRKSPLPSPEASGSHGVIPVQKNGKFVAGIMHF